MNTINQRKIYLDICSEFCSNRTKPLTDIPAERISDLYRKMLQEADACLLKAEEVSTDLVRSHFLERAWSFGSKASLLAHCIAKFGDLETHKMNADALRAEVIGLHCEGCNPWLGGIEIVEKELATIKA